MLDLLLAQDLQVHQPTGLVQVMLRSSFDGPSFRLLDHEQQQQHRDQSQPWSHLRGGNTVRAQHRSHRAQTTTTTTSRITNTVPRVPHPCVSAELQSGRIKTVGLTLRAQCQSCARLLTCEPTMYPRPLTGRKDIVRWTLPVGLL